MCCTELHKAYVLLNTIHNFLVCLDTNFESQNLAFVTLVFLCYCDIYFGDTPGL